MNLSDKQSEFDLQIRLCRETYYWTTVESYYNFQTQTTEYQYVNHIAQYSYLCGPNDQQSTIINGNPADYGL